MGRTSGWMAGTLGPVDFELDGVATSVPRRGVWNLIGFKVTDDPVNERTDIAFADLPTVQTEDATPVYVVLKTLALHEVAQVDVIAKVTKADGSVRQSFKFSALVYGAAGPVATLEDGSLTDADPKGTGAAVVELNLSGAGVRLKVTGIVDTDLVTTYDVSIV